MRNSPKTQVLHNPGAGYGSISKEELTELLEEEGWDFTYSSSKEHWTIEADTEVLIVAGGDGTVKKATAALFELKHFPVIGLLPMGTANNIATALGIQGKIREIVRSWKMGRCPMQTVECGTINHPVISDFFIEGIGFGIFPKMITSMEEKAKHAMEKTPDDNLVASLEAMYDACSDYAPVACSIDIDGKTISGEFLLVEIMNMPCVGPNVFFAPDADFSDGELDVVIARNEDRAHLRKYFKKKLAGKKDEHPLEIIKGSKIKVRWEGADFHLDDTLIKLDPGSEIRVGLSREIFKFLKP